MYEVIKNKNLIDSQIDSYLQKLLGNDFKEQLSTYYYRQQAYSHYHKSREIHIGGRAYYNLLEQMYFIKGDFDDTVSHFDVAIERFRLNTKQFQNNMEITRRQVKKSDLFDIDNYFEKGK